MKKFYCFVTFLIYIIAGFSEGSSSYHVFVFGDLTGSTVPGIYEKAVMECQRLKPDLALTVGDQIWGETNDLRVLNERWDKYFTLVKPLSMPLYLCPGNNDIENDVMADLWKKRTGKLIYYSFDFKGDHYVMLDSSRWDNPQSLPEEMLEWLQVDLAKAGSARYRIVIIHRPYWFMASMVLQPDPLTRILQNYDVNLVLSGHCHFHFYKEVKGILYIAAPSSGGGLPPLVSGAFFGYLWLTLSDEGIKWEAERLTEAND